MKQKEIESVIRARADKAILAKRLAVDYYRIRQRVSYPLPIMQAAGPKRAIRSIQNYPWSIWMIWALEERINSLGWAGEWLNDRAAAAAAARDLAALSKWSLEGEHGLTLGHTCRLLVSALRQWKWIDTDLRQ